MLVFLYLKLLAYRQGKKFYLPGMHDTNNEPLLDFIMYSLE